MLLLHCESTKETINLNWVFIISFLVLFDHFSPCTLHCCKLTDTKFSTRPVFCCTMIKTNNPSNRNGITCVDVVISMVIRE